MNTIVHRLKILPHYFADILLEVKSFEVRKNDRDFQVGDIVVLEEWNGLDYTGKFITVQITYILNNPDYCKNGYIIFGFKKRLDLGAKV